MATCPCQAVPAGALPRVDPCWLSPGSCCRAQAVTCCLWLLLTPGQLLALAATKAERAEKPSCEAVPEEPSEMGCELSIPQGTFLHRQTKGSAEVTEWKGDSGQMLVNPFACYLSSSKNSSSLDETSQAGAGRQCTHTPGFGIPCPWTRGLKPFHSEVLSTLLNFMSGPSV